MVAQTRKRAGERVATLRIYALDACSGKLDVRRERERIGIL